MFKDKQLIIFDLDGTLIDSAPSLQKALNKMLENIGYDRVTLKNVREFIGNGSLVLVQRALVKDKEYQKYKLDEKLVDRALKLLVKYYKEDLVSDTKLYSGVKEGLDELFNRGYKLALATNKPDEFVDNILKHFDIDRYFTVAVGAGVVERKKPHPDILLKVCSDLNIKSEDSVMVGDSINDIKGAQNANMDSIALTYGYSDIDLKELNPTVVCNSFTDMIRYF